MIWNLTLEIEWLKNATEWQNLIRSETILSFSPWATAFQICLARFWGWKNTKIHPLKNLLQPKKKFVAHHLGSHGPIKQTYVFFQFLYNPFLQIAINPMGFGSCFPMGNSPWPSASSAFAAVPPHRGRRRPRWGAAAARPVWRGAEAAMVFSKRMGIRYNIDIIRNIWYIINQILWYMIYDIILMLY